MSRRTTNSPWLRGYPRRGRSGSESMAASRRSSGHQERKRGRRRDTRPSPDYSLSREGEENMAELMVASACPAVVGVDGDLKGTAAACTTRVRSWR